VSRLVLFGVQSFSHCHSHEELLSEFLLAKGDSATRHYDTLTALYLALGDLLHNRCQTTQCQAVLVLSRDYGTAELDNQPLRIVQLRALREGRLPSIGRLQGSLVERFLGRKREREQCECHNNHL
jgi:hypothetical protein